MGGNFHGTPIAGWFRRENPIYKMDDLGLPSGDLLHFATLKMDHRTSGSTHENSMVALSSSFSSPFFTRPATPMTGRNA